MQKILIVYMVFFNLFMVYTQTTDLAQQWKDSVLSTEYFDIVENKEIAHLDFSEFVSTTTNKNNTALSAYTGVFGPNYRRIDFRLTAIKKENILNEYIVEGKSKLGNNIRPIKGKMTLNTVLMNKNLFGMSVPVYVCLFDYEFLEPGDKAGDGKFEGIFTAIFYNDKGKIKSFHSESGDFSEYRNVFVGQWKRYDSDTIRNCIFSFYPAGMFNSLPYCNELYSYEDGFTDFTYIKEKYRDFGWQDYNEESNHKFSW
ncbi:hypothetical protein [Costertonia aggregata]|uniref:Uncharacterized protein n=1 Tax=Costertonia aggregata TaxID=343403 RepID=A0A7H9ALD7_9FLAO|nr:hypothetical protein [Costertonia aggregata]QLG44183.1 hypothetical protein HYG79_02080 [Costertonia aggregata]